MRSALDIDERPHGEERGDLGMREVILQSTRCRRHDQVEQHSQVESIQNIVPGLDGTVVRRDETGAIRNVTCLIDNTLGKGVWESLGLDVVWRQAGASWNK